MKVEAATVRDGVLYLLLNDVALKGQRVVGVELLTWAYQGAIGMETFTFRTVDRPEMPPEFMQRLKMLNASDSEVRR